jgi:hypothetical protein
MMMQYYLLTADVSMIGESKKSAWLGPGVRAKNEEGETGGGRIGTEGHGPLNLVLEGDDTIGFSDIRPACALEKQAG